MSDIAEKLSSIEATLARMEKLWSDLNTKRVSRSVQAKRAGVHPSTLWRREKRAELELLANGRR
jgi:hypothetical protein